MCLLQSGRCLATNARGQNDTYATNNDGAASHRMGSLCTVMLYEVRWDLIEKYGKNDDSKLHLSMACPPMARDDILDADVTLTGGINAWEIRTDLDKTLDSGARHGITSTGSKTSPSKSYYGNGLEYS
ncbi:hypothetical protein BKA59DRAFT_455678 [Fusarium tricinctum]|uniref:Extracellular metalloproteinase n=1 Tax=Fusarium tricinctum TaxID=61284 RepID=A0A8K0S1N5_9HYPO|nr:hypothetical protein BKA59DRAFT_455678 [Fusarium tricinctum]